jgi:peptidoglycan/xylan/chitin deacetylase (PgdA/CDA1 family)
MKSLSYFILFLFCLNDFSDGKLEYDSEVYPNFESDFLVKKDSISNIPKRFLEFQKNSKGYCLVNGNSTAKQIALSFDDGPTEVSQKIIEILNKFNAKASFFWVGERIKGNEDIIQFAKENGHLIANHSWNHENGFSFSNQDLWEKQIANTFKEFSDYGIQDATFYRPPFGAITQKQIDFLATQNIKTVLWSITTMDWDANQNTDDLMFQKFKEHIHPGAIVLMHDADYGNLDSKLKDLENILKFGINQGYEFVTIAELKP